MSAAELARFEQERRRLYPHAIANVRAEWEHNKRAFAITLSVIEIEALLHAAAERDELKQVLADEYGDDLEPVAPPLPEKVTRRMAKVPVFIVAEGAEPPVHPPLDEPPTYRVERSDGGFLETPSRESALEFARRAEERNIPFKWTEPVQGAEPRAWTPTDPLGGGRIS